MAPRMATSASARKQYARSSFNGIARPLSKPRGLNRMILRELRDLKKQMADLNAEGIPAQLAELSRQIANLQDPRIQNNLTELITEVEAQQQNTTTLETHVALMQRTQKMDHECLEGAVHLVAAAVEGISTLNHQHQDLRRAIASTGQAPPAYQAAPQETPAAAGGQENPQGDLVAEPGLVPPGGTPSLIYLGRALDQNDLTVIHSWYQRLETRVRNHARYSVEEYHRLLGGRNRVEIRESLPRGFLHGWVPSHSDDSFRYFIPAVPAPGWPVHIKLRVNPCQTFFITAIVYDDTVGPRPCQDPNILQAFYPANITAILDTSSLFWEKAQLLSKTRDIDGYAGAMLDISGEFSKQWHEANCDLAESINDAPRQKALTDMLQRQKKVNNAVLALIESPRRPKEGLWEDLASVLDQGREEWAVASYVLRSAIYHELADDESINTDMAEMFEDPFTGALLAWADEGPATEPPNNNGAGGENPASA